MATAYRFGIEEEYFLADAATRGTASRRAVTAFHAAARKQLPAAEREMLQAQVEVSTPPSSDFAASREILAGFRARLSEVAQARGLLVFAAGTHPVARWTLQRRTEAERYRKIVREHGMVAARNAVCGLHVHVEVPRPKARVGLMNRLMPFLPLLLALSISSPFWQGRRTGLAGYRLSAHGELPRTGLPDLFDGPEDYERYVRLMTTAGGLPDASFIWWALRPSVRFPTLELRVADSCARLADALAIAALYRCLVRHADRRPELNAGLTGASRAIAAENMWRVQRDGVHATLIDEASGTATPVAARLDAVLALVAEDADALGCAPQVEAARGIVAAGSGADRQLAVFREARDRGLTDRGALSAVVDWLAAETAGTASAAR